MLPPHPMALSLNDGIYVGQQNMWNFSTGLFHNSCDLIAQKQIEFIEICERKIQIIIKNINYKLNYTNITIFSTQITLTSDLNENRNSVERYKLYSNEVAANMSRLERLNKAAQKLVETIGSNEGNVSMQVCNYFFYYCVFYFFELDHNSDLLPLIAINKNFGFLKQA